MLSGCPSIATARRFTSSRSTGRPASASPVARPATIAAADEPQPAASGSSFAISMSRPSPSPPPRIVAHDEVRGVGRQLVGPLAATAARRAARAAADRGHGQPQGQRDAEAVEPGPEVRRGAGNADGDTCRRGHPDSNGNRAGGALPQGVPSRRGFAQPTSGREVTSVNHEITLTVNGAAHTVAVEPRRLLVHVLREDLGLTGTHIGCDTQLVRRLHDPRRRRGGARVLDPRRAGRRRGDPHGRGPRGERRAASRSSGRSTSSTACSAASARPG